MNQTTPPIQPSPRCELERTVPRPDGLSFTGFSLLLVTDVRGSGGRA